MSAYPFLVQTAWNTLGELLRQWQDAPFRWSTEIDIQAELGGRISQVLSLQGLGTVKGSYGHGLPTFSEQQIWNRVGYEPTVHYEENGNRHFCRPDVVIWDDPLSDSNEADGGSKWPIAWACELKYGSRDSGEWDTDKLRRLLELNRINFGCSINIHYRQSSSGVTVDWRQTGRGTKLWVCDVWAPQPISDAP